jgi:endonuclease/exonuclease/phosphatase family metal-dependent hydrolase
MTELTVGAWNASNAFGDERAPEALDLIDQISPRPDVLFLGEMALCGRMEERPFQNSVEMLQKFGYSKYEPSPYAADDSPRDPRNQHVISMWSRLDSASIDPVKLGRNYGMRATIPELDLAVYGLHGDHISGDKRQLGVSDLLADRAAGGYQHAIAMGDWNDMLPRDPRSWPLRAAGVFIGGIEDGEYYDRGKLGWYLGAAVRMSRMARGNTMRTMQSAGFHDADPHRIPRSTFHGKGANLALDRILASTGVQLSDYQVHDRYDSTGGRPISDHSPVSARARVAA